MTFAYLMQLLANPKRRDWRRQMEIAEGPVQPHRIGGWADEVLVESDRIQVNVGIQPEMAVLQAMANLRWAFLRIRKRNQLHFGGQQERMVHRVGRPWKRYRQGHLELMAEAACCSSASTIAAIAPPYDLSVIQELSPGKLTFCKRCFPSPDIAEERAAAARKAVETRRKNAERKEIDAVRARLRPDERILLAADSAMVIVDGDPVALDQQRRVVPCEMDSPGRIGCAAGVVAKRYVVVQLAKVRHP